MRAVLVEGEGKKSKLVLGEVPSPAPSQGEVLVKVRATSVNQADLLQRRGLYPPPPGTTDILGLDFAGEVVDKGKNTRLREIGDKVFGFIAGGGYGEFVAVHEELMWPVPENLDFENAAAVGEVFATAYLNLFILGRLKRGEKVLIHGGSGGVGTAAIQLVRQAGAVVFTTVATDEGRKLCEELGAFCVINYENEDFEGKIMQKTSSEGVNLIIDFVGAPYIEKHVNILAEHGRLILIGLKGGTKAELFLPPLLTKKLTIMGSVLRTLSFEKKLELVKKFGKSVLPLLENGQVFPVIDSIFPISQVEEAHERFRKSKHLGKIVLTWHTVDSP